MSTYPIILIPKSIENAQNALPSVPYFTVPKPVKSSDSPQPLEINTLIAESTIALFVCLGLAFVNSLLGMLVGFGCIATIAYHVFTMQRSFPKRKRIHDDAVRIYPQRLNEYQQARAEHQEKINQIRSPNNVSEYRRKQLLSVLCQTEAYDGNRSKAQEGFSELKFYAYLNNYFKGKIYRGLTLNIPNFQYPYSPDFTYINRELNLYIDIEIDEPYEYMGRQATHYLYSEKDNNRNSFFLFRGWIVIRFAEEQVVLYPQSCCKAIAKVISNVLGDNSDLMQFCNVPDLPLLRQWTELEAFEMSSKQYRETYLAND